MKDIGLLELNSVLATAAFGGLLWRLIGRWSLASWLSRCVISLFAMSQFLIGLAAARRSALGGEFNEVQYLVTIHSTLVLVIVVVWHRLLDKTGQRT